MKKLFLICSTTLLLNAYDINKEPLNFKTKQDILNKNELIWTKQYNSFSTKMKELVPLSSYINERVKEKQIDYILNNSNGIQYDTFVNYCRWKQINIDYLTPIQYREAISFSQKIPTYGLIDYKIEELKDLTPNDINNFIKNIQSNSFSFGEKKYLIFLLSKIFNDKNISNKILYNLKELRPNINDLKNTSLINTYFNIFIDMKDIRQFKDFIIQSINDSKDPYIKSIIIETILIFDKKKNILLPLEKDVYSKLLISSVKEIDINRYKEYFILKENMISRLNHFNETIDSLKMNF